mgnify:FL=1
MDNIEKLLITGPSKKVNEIPKKEIEDLLSNGYKIFSYTDSLFYLQKIGIKPHYFSFLDPYTIGRKMNFYENDSFLSDTSLMIYDLYENDLSTFYRYGFTCNSFIRDFRSSYEKFISLKFQDNFKEVIKKDSTCIDITHPKFASSFFDYKKQLYIFSGNKKTNTDKFSCVLIPMILNFFPNLKEIKSVGFGDFDTPRYYNDGSKGYPEFINTFYIMKNNTVFNLENSSIKIDFFRDNFYKKELS